jgi:dolichol-phosphate mannosyltransferase
VNPEHPRISIVIPTLNEADNVEPVTRLVLEHTAPFNPEILIVDDNSKDGTQERVRELESSRPVRLIARERPTHGLAGAVLAGARESRADVVLVMDADLSHPPERVPDLVRPLLDGSKDMIIGSRYAKGGGTPGWPWVRRAMSRSASAVAWPLTDVQDALAGFFAVKRELLASIPPDAAGFKIALEVLVRGGDTLRVGEVPIIFRDRTAGESKMGMRVILTYFRRVLALSGWRESSGSVAAAIGRSAAVWGLDATVFLVLLARGTPWQQAHVAAFACAWSLHFALKRRQLNPDEARDHRFFPTFLFVAALALLLRHATLEGAMALGLPPAIDIFPAIIASWFVGYVGYALFIFPRKGVYSKRTRRRLALAGLLAFAAALAVVSLPTLFR